MIRAVTFPSVRVLIKIIECVNQTKSKSLRITSHRLTLLLYEHSEVPTRYTGMVRQRRSSNASGTSEVPERNDQVGNRRVTSSPFRAQPTEAIPGAREHVRLSGKDHSNRAQRQRQVRSIPEPLSNPRAHPRSRSCLLHRIVKNECVYLYLFTSRCSMA